MSPPMGGYCTQQVNNNSQEKQRRINTYNQMYTSQNVKKNGTIKQFFNILGSSPYTSLTQYELSGSTGIILSGDDGRRKQILLITFWTDVEQQIKQNQQNGGKSE